MNAEYASDYDKFDAEAFLDVYLTGVKTSKLQQDEMTWLHQAFENNKIKGRRLLDIGSGPSMHTVITASDHVDDIFLSDIAPQNREMLSKWLNGTSQHCYQEHFQLAVDAEGKGVSPVDKEMMVREKISGIIHIDLLQKYPLAPSFFPKFDVITSSFCFISAAKDVDTYEMIAKRVPDLLNDGGHLFLFSLDGPNCYPVGNCSFRALVITTEKVKDIWRKCGFEIVEWKQECGTQIHHELNSYYLMVAKKVKTLS